MATGEDLRALGEWVGEAPLVGLGEGEHGTHEMHRLADRFFRYLVAERGFTVFALEIDSAHGALLDDFVTGRRDDLDEILERRWWASEVFYDQALRELLLWMRAYNTEAEEPLRFAGFDLKQPDLAAELLAEELERLAPGTAKEVRALFASMAEIGGYGGVPDFGGFRSIVRLPLPPDREGEGLLRVELGMRAQGMTMGSAGFQVSTGAARATSSPLAEELPADQWRPSLAEIPSPDATEVEVTLFHRGNGTVWFDGLTASLDGRALEVAANLSSLQPEPPPAPRLQLLDYKAKAAAEVSYRGRLSLAVERDPRLDATLDAAARIVALVEKELRIHPELDIAAARRMKRLARLVEQAVAWRTLAQPNRDVFLAENLTWLAREGHPGSRILALAHASHSEKLPRRMGGFLAETHGPDYRTVSMYSVAGEYRGFGSLRTLETGDRPEVLPLAPDRVRSNVRYLASLAP
ncbi:MAG: erythromycin esterase family protein, partial [Acidobacteria bacterium]|nr:erythromycin esterase family protein [Acidobacteriota bacterium]